jgi:hypothetical protein
MRNRQPDEEALKDSPVSGWLEEALMSALKRDPADALNDVLALAEILEARLREVLELGLHPSGRFA